MEAEPVTTVAEKVGMQNIEQTRPGKVETRLAYGGSPCAERRS